MLRRDDDFDPQRDIPDLRAKVAIVTGANTGIGYETAKSLAARGARVYLACRNSSRARKAIEDITRDLRTTLAGPQLFWLPCDLSTVRGARKAADEFTAREKRLDILVNNAAHLSDKYELNEDGVESTMATNHIGHFTLTTLLFPILAFTASIPGTSVRIVTVTSELHTLIQSKHHLHTLDDLNAPMSNMYACADGTIAAYMRYSASKLANVLFTRAMQRRLDLLPLPRGARIIATCIHPGMVSSSNMVSHVPRALRPFLSLFSVPPDRGAYTTLFAATSPRAAEFAGGYLVPFGKLGKTGKAAEGETGEELWRLSEAIVSGAPPYKF